MVRRLIDLHSPPACAFCPSRSTAIYAPGRSLTMTACSPVTQSSFQRTNREK